MPQHPSPGLGYRWIWRNPAVGAQCHPLGMGGGCILPELHRLLLLCAHQPAFSAGLFWWFMGGAVTGQVSGATANRRQLCKASCCRGDAPSARWRIRCLNGGPNRAGRWSGLRDAGESDGILMDALLLSSRKRSLSQSKRGLREASGGLGLRPRSDQGMEPLHGSMHRSSPWGKMLNHFLFL